MAKTRNLSLEERAAIVTLHKEGYNQTAISRKLSVSRSAIQEIIRKKNETGTVADRKRSGRPRKTTERQDEYLVLSSRRNKRATAAQLRKELENATGINVSKTTVKVRLHEAGIRGCVAVRKPLLSEKHRKNRRQWAKVRKEWGEDEWSRVVFSDESSFELFGSSQQLYVHRKPGEKFLRQCLAPTVKFGGGKVMVWGSMAQSGVGSLRIMEGSVTSASYVRLLSTCLQRDGESLVGDNFIFQQDNAPAHTAKATKNWFERKKIDVLQWPAQSPDLNPIEHFWVIMKRRVAQKCPQSIPHLIKIIEEVWKSISSETTKRLVQSMPRRVRAVIGAKGGSTRY